jgi:hypothetical protein
MLDNPYKLPVNASSYLLVVVVTFSNSMFCIFLIFHDYIYFNYFFFFLTKQNFTAWPLVQWRSSGKISRWMNCMQFAVANDALEHIGIVLIYSTKRGSGCRRQWFLCSFGRQQIDRLQFGFQLWNRFLGCLQITYELVHGMSAGNIRIGSRKVSW